jgi:hypothetical protein
MGLGFCTRNSMMMMKVGKNSHTNNTMQNEMYAKLMLSNPR